MMRRILFMFLVLLAFTGLSGQDSSMTALIQKIDARSKQYVDYNSFSSSVVSTYKEMDDKGNPEKEMIVHKQVRRSKEGESETILKAMEIKGGEETDITDRLREEEKKKEEKDEIKKNKQGSQIRKEKKQTFSLSSDELLPFVEGKRKLFTFVQAADTVISDKTLLCIQTIAKEKKNDLYEGKYYVDPETYDIIFLVTTPSKNPKFVKRMRIKMGFEILPGNYWVLKNLWMKMDAGFLFKKIRFEIEEIYSDIQVDG